MIRWADTSVRDGLSGRFHAWQPSTVLSPCISCGSEQQKCHLPVNAYIPNLYVCFNYYWWFLFLKGLIAFLQQVYVCLSYDTVPSHIQAFLPILSSQCLFKTPFLRSAGSVIYGAHTEWTIRFLHPDLSIRFGFRCKMEIIHRQGRIRTKGV